MTRNPAQATLFDLPRSKAPSALPRWWRVKIIDLPATDDGLALLDDVLLDILARNIRLLRAIEERTRLLGQANLDRSPLGRFLDLHEQILDRIVASRTSSISAEAIPEVVTALRDIDRDLTHLREAILDGLPPDQREGVLEHERTNRGHRHDASQIACRLELEEAERRGELVEFDMSWRSPRPAPPPAPPGGIGSLARRGGSLVNCDPEERERHPAGRRKQPPHGLPEGAPRGGR